MGARLWIVAAGVGADTMGAMLETRYNAATDTEEIQRLTPGPWSTRGMRGSRLSGSDWAVQGLAPDLAFPALGLARTDTVRLMRIETAGFEADLASLGWSDEVGRICNLYRAIFADSWAVEGATDADLALRWGGEGIENGVSGVGEAGLILAERYIPDPERGLFYLTFGVHPVYRGVGAGLALYRTSLARARALGYEYALWCCMASNVAINRLMERLGAEVQDEVGFWEGPLVEGEGEL